MKIEKRWIIEHNGGLELFKENARLGNTLQAIANEIGVSLSDVYFYLKEKGTSYSIIKKENPVLRTFKERIEYDGGMEWMEFLAKEGFSAKEVARNYGFCCEYVVYRYLYEHGETWASLKE